LLCFSLQFSDVSFVGNHFKQRLSVTLRNFFVENWQRNCPKTKNCLKLWPNFSQKNFFLEILGNIFLENGKTSMCVCVFSPGKSDVTFVGNNI
jgi:hypothetical protein